MAGPKRQRTFELVPLVTQHAPKKPMTLKQAKKKAQEASKRPKMSRAERARLEKEELDSLRKERERQRASEKAKAAREKRASKLAEEKAERRRLGIPEPSRLVREGQPIISAFIQLGSKRRKTEVEPAKENLVDASEDERNLGEEAERLPQESRQLDKEEISFLTTGNASDLPPILLPLQGVPSSQHEPSIGYGPSSGKQATLSPPENIGNPPRALGSASLQQPPQTAISPLQETTKNNLRSICEQGSEDGNEFDNDAELFAAMAESTDLDGTLAEQKQVRSLQPSTGHSSTSARWGDPSTPMPLPSLPQKLKRTASKERESFERQALPITSILTPGRGNNTTNPNGSASPAKSSGTKPSHHISPPNNYGVRPLGNKSVNIPPSSLSTKRMCPKISSTSSVAPPPRQQVSRPLSSLPPSTLALLTEDLDAFFSSPTQEMRELARDDDQPINDPLDGLADWFPTPTQEMRELEAEDKLARPANLATPTTRRGTPAMTGPVHPPESTAASVPVKPQAAR